MNQMYLLITKYNKSQYLILMKLLGIKLLQNLTTLTKFLPAKIQGLNIYKF